jgi:DNA-binding NarL/FixJ family response regulator
VVLADDHTLVRAGIRSLLQAAGIRVVAEAADGREAVRLVEQHRPDVAILDIAMVGMNGLEAAERMMARAPECGVVMLSMHSAEEYIAKAARLGVRGYLIKDAAALELKKAVRAVARGGTYLPRGVSLRQGWFPESSFEQLTLRQRETLQLIGEGKSTKEIASILRISVKTAETHRTQLMERLDIHEVAGLVRYAIRVGLVSPER